MKRGAIDMTKHVTLMSQGLEDVFDCKTCHRRFSSFQALGGHRASHKKPRIMMEEYQNTIKANDSKFIRPKMHECGICGKEFESGQALGGHMRKHRVSVYESFNPSPIVPKAMPVLSRSNSKRVLCVDLDLNLTPLENDLKALFGNIMASNNVDLR